MKQASPYLQAAVLGVIAGMRSMMAPAFASALLNKYPATQSERNFDWLRTKSAGRISAALALGEMVGDKLPAAPNRIAAPGLAGRLVTGALAGAAICNARHQNAVAGALIGAAASVASSYAFFYTRQAITDSKYLDNTAAGLTEDALALSIGAILLA